jgi:hypothetical protein
MSCVLYSKRELFWEEHNVTLCSVRYLLLVKQISHCAEASRSSSDDTVNTGLRENVKVLCNFCVDNLNKEDTKFWTHLCVLLKSVS